MAPDRTDTPLVVTKNLLDLVSMLPHGEASR